MGILPSEMDLDPIDLTDPRTIKQPCTEIPILEARTEQEKRLAVSVSAERDKVAERRGLANRFVGWFKVRFKF